MKYNVLAAVVAGALLSACNNGSGSDSSTYSLQAYDPAIQGMAVSYQCGDATESTSSGETNYYGNAVIDNETVSNAPDECEFTFVGGTDAVDTSNSKSMSGVTYTIPRGLAQAGTKVTASPLTTLIAAELDGADYNETTATTVLTALGLNDLITSDVSISDLLLDTESVVAALDSTSKSKLLATTTVLSDLITNDTAAGSTTLDVDTIATSSKTYAAAIITETPNYPVKSDGTSATHVITKTSTEVAALSATELTTDVTDTEEEATVVYNPDDATGTGTGTGSTTTGG